jgi:GT2 family glycosyltransferase
MSAWPEATLFVVNWNGQERLQAYLPALLAQDYPNYRVVVVDNNSSDASVEWLQHELPQVGLVRLPENMGYGPALNRALQQTASPLVGFLNNDVAPAPDWLREMAAALLADEQVGLVGSKLYYPDGSTLQHAGGMIGYPLALAMHYGYRERDEGQHDQPADVDYVTGAAVLGRRETLERFGYFDEHFRFYFEEADLCYRLRHAGLRVRYVPTATAIHHESLTIVRDSPEYLQAYHRGRLCYVLKHYTLAQFLSDFLPAERARHAIVPIIELGALSSAYRGVGALLATLNTRRTAPPWSVEEQGQVAEQVRQLAAGAERWTLRQQNGSQPQEAVAEPALSELQALIAQLQAQAVVAEQPFHSPLPLVGPAIAAIRAFVNDLGPRWHVRKLLDQQVQYNLLLVRALAAVQSQLTTLHQTRHELGWIRTELEQLRLRDVGDREAVTAVLERLDQLDARLQPNGSQRQGQP